MRGELASALSSFLSASSSIDRISGDNKVEFSQNHKLTSCLRTLRRGDNTDKVSHKECFRTLLRVVLITYNILSELSKRY